ncbi:MAG: PhzA/PhzB family protein [Ottowia sp.]|uniref:PhzA/PhzB family protein n=1 Tax=Ottowia sp. TaxID=1898956 RepID=UPI0039E5516A
MDNSALRAKNRKTVEAFLELRGPDRGPKRAVMFAPDSKVELWVRDGAYLDVNGREWCMGTPDTFPIWGFYEATIYETADDPNSFLVPAVGRGQVFAPGGKGPGHDVEIWYVLLFELHDGMITRFRETVDYCRGGDIITEQYTPERPDLFVHHDNPFNKKKG